MICAIVILMIILPSFVRTVFDYNNHISQSRKILQILQERAYAFQLYINDLENCEVIELNTISLSCIESERKVVYECKNNRLRRKENGQYMYLSKQWKLSKCNFKKSNHIIQFNAISGNENLDWSIQTTETQRVHIN